MWVAKIILDGRNAVIGCRTLKYKVNMTGFPLSYSYSSNYIIVNLSGNISGEEKNKKKFIKEWKKSGGLINLELNEDFFIATIKEPLFLKPVYNSDIIHLAPAIIDENGMESIEVGCFSRIKLNKLVNLLAKRYNSKIQYIKEKKIKSISIMRQYPELTEKQRKAIELAIKKGYYEVPRKISVEELAKMAELSFSTFQVHLRKAGKNLIPFYF